MPCITRHSIAMTDRSARNEHGFSAWAHELHFPPHPRIREFPAISPFFEGGEIVRRHAATVTALLAYCTACTVKPERGVHTDQLAAAVALDMTQWWQLTVPACLGRVSKTLILEAVTEGKSAAHSSTARTTPAPVIALGPGVARGKRKPRRPPPARLLYPRGLAAHGPSILTDAVGNRVTRPPAQILACGFPAPGSYRRSDVIAGVDAAIRRLAASVTCRFRY